MRLLKVILMMVVLTLSVSAKDKLVMGMIPAEDPHAMMDQYKPMVAWLEKKIGAEIKLFTATDYTGVIEAMRANRVDIAWFGPFSYVLASERANAEAFAVGMKANGVTTYQSYLVGTPEVAKKLGISSPLEGEAGMKELANKLAPYKKKFAVTFTDPASTSGFAVPRFFMERAGMTPKKYFKKVGFVGTHDASALVVKNNIIQVGAISNVSYTKMLEKGKISKESNIILWKSPDLPGSPLAVRSSLDNKIKSALKKYITKVPQDVVTGYGKIAGYKLVEDKDYQLVKDIKKVIDTVN